MSLSFQSNCLSELWEKRHYIVMVLCNPKKSRKSYTWYMKTSDKRTLEYAIFGQV